MGGYLRKPDLAPALRLAGAFIWQPAARLPVERVGECLLVVVANDEARRGPFGGSWRRETENRTFARLSITGETINDFARLVLHGDARLRLFWPLVFPEVVYDSTGYSMAAVSAGNSVPSGSSIS
jgi:hypothetical protein